MVRQRFFFAQIVFSQHFFGPPDAARQDLGTGASAKMGAAGVDTDAN